MGTPSAPLFLLELADEIRQRLCDAKLRSRAAEILNEAIARHYDAGEHAHSWSKPPSDWPLPNTGRVEEPPGCVLAVCAINDFAAGRPKLFDGQDVAFSPFLPEPMKAPQFWFSAKWVNAVAGFGPEHEPRLRTVVARAFEHLGGKAADAAAQAVGFLGGIALADALGVHSTRRDAFFRKLERCRTSLGDDFWHEVSEPRPNSPRFLYRADAPAMLGLAANYKVPKPA